MPFFEKEFPYVITSAQALLLLLYLYRKRFHSDHQQRFVLYITGFQLVVHFYLVSDLLYRIRTKLGFLALPPHNQYLLTEAISGLQPIIVGAIHSAIWFALLWFIFLRRGKGMMLDVQDVQLLVLGLLAVGWPAGLIFLAATFLLAVVGMIGLVIVRKKKLNDRLVITPYIIPAAILTLFFGSWAMRLTHLDKIRF